MTILVLRFGALGDILRTLPAVRLMRSALPECRIVWVLDETWRAVVQDHPDVEEVVALPRSRWNRWLGSPIRWISLLFAVHTWGGQLRSRRPSLALDFHGNFRSGMTGWLSGAPVHLGYGGHQQKEANRIFTTHRVPAGPRRISRIERNLALVRALGLRLGPIPDGGLRFRNTTLEKARRLVAEHVGREGPHAILSPGVSKRQAYKQPPVDLLVAAARKLADRGIAPLVVYGPGEESHAATLVRHSGGCAHLAPPTDLWTLAALLRQGTLFVGGDTGPLHLACAVGCPVVGIYGPTDPVVNGPWGVRHRVIQPPGTDYSGIKKKDRRMGRFDRISPKTVETAVEEVLAGSRS